MDFHRLICSHVFVFNSNTIQLGNFLSIDRPIIDTSTRSQSGPRIIVNHLDLQTHITVTSALDKF